MRPPLKTDATSVNPPGTSRTHLVLIPSYNPGPKVFETVRAAREHWQPVWIVVDGSTDGTAASLASLAQDDPGLRVLRRPEIGRASCWGTV